ncbi:MAG: hypothetical protein HUJ31_19505, partial [Pseudomonadales bacterium]|nr:hypothetical protein [Pseudomonadales bacterium]
MQHLINELKRRNVFRATAAYSVVGWVIGQVADLVLSAFEAPPWVLKTVIALLVIGLPLVMVLAWVYELTPEGLRRTAEDDSPETHTEGSRVIDSIIILALVAAVLAVTAIPDDWSDDLSRHTGNFGKTQTEQSVSRVVVLPTVNVSIDSESSALSSGFSGLLREELQLYPNVQTLGRESSLLVREKNIPAAVIAGDYHIDYIVQTSLRANDTEIVMDLQLIDTHEDREVWNRTFRDKNENVKNMFTNGLHEVQRELGLAERDFAGSTLDRAAFNLWLRTSRPAPANAEQLAERKADVLRIIELAPDFGPARMEAARLTLEAAELPGGPTFDQESKEVRKMLEQALGSSSAAAPVRQLRPEIESRLSIWR